MDNARWLVIFSALISMIAVLTFMNRFSTDARVLPAATPVIQIAEQKSVVYEPKTDLIKRGAVRKKYGQIKFSKPPAHTFAVESNDEFRKMDASQKDSGRILE